MKRPVILRDIAAKSGFQCSTVSMALRGDPRIKSTTRETIMRIAEEMGYQPNPMLKALSVYRQSVKPAHYRATIAWFSNTKEPQIDRPEFPFKSYVLGARTRGEELGYKIEEFVLRAPGMTLDRLKKILQARNIDGILVAPQPAPHMKVRIGMDWAPFHAISFCQSLAWPALHIVSAYHSGNTKLAVRKLFSLGYRRIGLVIDRVGGGRTDGNWLGGYMAEMMYRNLEPRVFLRSSSSEIILLTDAESPRLRKWILKEKLDALIFDYSPPFVEWLPRVCGLRVPEDIGVVSLNVQSDDPLHSGIDQHEKEIGWYAMDTLVNMTNTHDRGIPAVPHQLQIMGTWREGRTVRRIAARRSQAR